VKTVAIVIIGFRCPPVGLAVEKMKIARMGTTIAQEGEKE
jgi:hypothetical protein